MKKSLLFLGLIISSVSIFAQTTTNAFPPSGNVGIGTINPEEKLHILGSIRGNASGGALRINTTSGYLDVGSQNSGWAHIYTDRPKIIFNKDVYTTSNAFSSYNSDLILKTKGTERFRINDVTGNVGIGTTNPAEKLHVNGNILSNGVNINSIGTNNWKPLTIGRKTATNKYNFEFIVDPNNANGYLAMGLIDDNDIIRYNLWTKPDQTVMKLSDQNNFEFFGIQNNLVNNQKSTFIHLPNPDSRIVIGQYGGYKYDEGHKLVVKDGSALIEGNVFATGNVGIGTTTPDSKLTVKGKIHAEEIKIDLSVPVPDYVFLKDYDLKSIGDVEAYIQQEGHLPNIPSAKEMEANGVELGIMNMKLLEKIEELTLYTIAQEKQLEQQNAINQKLQTQNQELADRLAKIEALLVAKQ
ncbi:tail fiber protein [Aquimarina sp. 2201CG5-10]|uniref:tail fiber protein n=1 Tax=Aquimarina callyspongiae TaxID=3098150 RepID=UPI002AB38CB8|nr:tail fiber protein [Aquimarina sp. 2201CG5-10]MDY8138918.1 tail fiber protein [Aquimarina sp. 2201CG5-10]